MKLLSNFILRSPLLPYQTDEKDVFQVFKDSWHFREAIYLSSKGLYKIALQIQQGIISDMDKIDKVRTSLLKYLKRVSYRPTPYGLNAGVSIGTMGDKTNIYLTSQDQYSRLIRFDMGFLGKVYREMLNIVEIKNDLLWFPNNSIYEVHDSYRYYDYQFADGDRHYQLSQIKRTDELNRLLKLASKGIRISEIIHFFGNHEYTSEEIIYYIDELITSKLLISEMEPSVSGRFYGEVLIEFLANKKYSSIPFVQNFLKLSASLKILARQTNRPNLNGYDELVHDAKKSGLPYHDDLLQIDLFKQLNHGTLERSLFTELNEAFYLINALNHHVKYPNRLLIERFILEFEKRYEGMEIPLAVALDPDIGIGYPVGQDIEVDEELSEELSPSAAPSVLYDFRNPFQRIIKKYYECISEHKSELNLTREDFEPLHSKNTFSAGVLSTMVSIIRTNNVDKLVHLGTEPVGISLGARFSHLNEDIHQFHQEVSRKEEDHFQRHNMIVAEVVFQPSEKGGNIISKPHLRRYEIPMVTQSSLPQERIIPMEDIMISVQNGRIYLRSKSRGTNIIPRFSAIFNPKKCKHAAFNFFTDLRYQYCDGSLNWSWGILNNMPHTPRVNYKNVIIARAKWVVSIEDITNHVSGSGNLNTFFIEKRIPLRICLSQQDDFLLPLNLNNETDRKLFFTEIRKYRSLTLIEDIFANTDLVVRDSQAGYTNEFVVYWDNLVSEPIFSSINRLPHFKSKKVITPGENWLFYSIFCGQPTAEKILKEDLYKSIDKLNKNGSITSWFFIRYAHPSYHIRLRIQLNQANNREPEIEIRGILSRLLQEGVIWDIKEEVYNRELHRYGDLNIVNVESFFWIDSDYVVKVLGFFSPQELSTLRWKIALAGVHFLFDDFNFSLQERIALLLQMKKYMFAEHGFDKKYTKWFKYKYRKETKSIAQVIQHQFDDLAKVYPLLNERSERNKPFIGNMRLLNQRNELGVSMNDLLSSLVHMHLNRIFLNKPRLQETVIYDLMHTYYTSQQARINDLKSTH